MLFCLFFILRALIAKMRIPKLCISRLTSLRRFSYRMAGFPWCLRSPFKNAQGSSIKGGKHTPQRLTSCSVLNKTFFPMIIDFFRLNITFTLSTIPPLIVKLSTGPILLEI